MSLPARFGLHACALAAVLGAAAPGQAATSFADVVDQVRPSIAGVGTIDTLRSPPARMHGTGFVVGNGNLVATNLHVVEMPLDGRHKEHLAIFVGRGPLADSRNVEVVATDRVHDLALLRFEGAPLPALRLAPEPAVREGNAVAFTGFPIGGVLGLYPVTHHGMVSALTPIATSAPRAKQLSREKISALREPYDVIQLDATAYPGNSGSPLYRRRDGAVVGIINQVLVKSTKEDILRNPSAITYAIPVGFLHTLLATLADPH
jgi:S1-C subfamily serine protease